MDWGKLKIKEFKGKYNITNVWEDKVIGTTEKIIKAQIPNRDVVLFKLIPVQ